MIQDRHLQEEQSLVVKKEQQVKFEVYQDGIKLQYEKKDQRHYVNIHKNANMNLEDEAEEVEVDLIVKVKTIQRSIIVIIQIVSC